MNVQIIGVDKRIYNAPQIERILLDNEISLILQSSAPDDPEDWFQDTGAPVDPE